MEKTEAVNKLKKAGYQVQFDSSVVTVLLGKRANITQEIKKLKSYLQEIGYDASFSVKQIKDDSTSERKDVVLKSEESLQDTVEEISEQEEMLNQKDVLKQEGSSESDEVFEIGEQFSLEDFGIN